MRRQLTVNCEAGTIVVREMRPRDLLNLMQVLKDAESITKQDRMYGLFLKIRENFANQETFIQGVAGVEFLLIEILDIAPNIEDFLIDAKCLQMPTDGSLYDLSISEFSEVLKAFYDLHKESVDRFFPKAKDPGVAVQANPLPTAA